VLKRILFAFTLTLMLTAYSSLAHALTTGAPDVAECGACHKLNIDEAASLLAVEKFNAKVVSVKPAQILGLWEVTLEQTNPQDASVRTVTAYMDFGKKMLVEARMTPLSSLGGNVKIDISKIPSKDALILGNPKAKHKVFIFTDPDCPYCRKFHAEAVKIAKDFKDIAFYIVLFPLDIHPGAYDKALAINCEKSVKLLEDAFEGKTLEAAKCDSKKTIDANLAAGKNLGISGTPAIVFPDGTLNSGTLPYDAFIKMFDRLMKTKYSEKLEKK